MASKASRYCCLTWTLTGFLEAFHKMAMQLKGGVLNCTVVFMNTLYTSHLLATNHPSQKHHFMMLHPLMAN